MIDANKLQYATMAAWMRGYMAQLDEYKDQALAHQLAKAADMFDAVWDEHMEAQQEETK